MRRGRPKYDDVLTPREWEVLDLLRQGKTNEQIAAHLGISVNGAKFHVSEIITKLGVRSRREAAARPVAPRVRQLAPSFLLPFGLLRFAAVAVLVLAAAGVIALAVGVLINDGRGSSQTVVSPPSPTPVSEGATPAPTLTAAQANAARRDATATAIASRPSPTPTPMHAPVGEPIPVWVYADVEPASRCLELVGVMIPMSAPDTIPGKAVECTLTDDSRITLVKQDDDNYHLESVLLLLLIWEEWPPLERTGQYECQDVRDTLLLSTEAPKAATFSGVCRYVPAYRDEPDREELHVWTRVENSEAPADLPPDVPCEVAGTYLGPPEYDEAGLREVTCLLR